MPTSFSCSCGQRYQDLPLDHVTKHRNFCCQKCGTPLKFERDGEWTAMPNKTVDDMDEWIVDLRSSLTVINRHSGELVDQVPDLKSGSATREVPLVIKRRGEITV